MQSSNVCFFFMDPYRQMYINIMENKYNLILKMNYAEQPLMLLFASSLEAFIVSTQGFGWRHRSSSSNPHPWTMKIIGWPSAIFFHPRSDYVACCCGRWGIMGRKRARSFALSWSVERWSKKKQL